MSNFKVRKQFKESIKSKVTIFFKGICQSCGSVGIIKKYAGCYFRAYSKRIRSWRGKPIPFEVHHIIPISLGGTNSYENLTLLCRKCHKKSHTKNAIS